MGTGFGGRNAALQNLCGLLQVGGPVNISGPSLHLDQRRHDRIKIADRQQRSAIAEQFRVELVSPGALDLRRRRARMVGQCGKDFMPGQIAGVPCVPQEAVRQLVGEEDCQFLIVQRFEHRTVQHHMHFPRNRNERRIQRVGAGTDKS